MKIFTLGRWSWQSKTHILWLDSHKTNFKQIFQAKYSKKIHNITNHFSNLEDKSVQPVMSPFFSKHSPHRWWSSLAPHRISAILWRIVCACGGGYHFLFSLSRIFESFFPPWRSFSITIGASAGGATNTVGANGSYGSMSIGLSGSVAILAGQAWDRVAISQRYLGGSDITYIVREYPQYL